MKTLSALVLGFTSLALGATQLKFKSNGSFKIAQFADIHFANGEISPCNDILPSQRPCNDYNTTDFIGRVLDLEKPDLAVFTGDNIAGTLNAAKAIGEYSRPAYERGIPWAMVFGNHDEESNLDREEMMQVTLSLPYAISERGPTDVFGVGNYVVQLMDSNGVSNLFNLYFIDSGDYSKKEGIGGYEWIRPSQVQWFMENSKSFKEMNGKTVPALAFFHIPIPEYEQVTDKVGDTQEGVFDAEVNSGLFSALLESGDVKATFVGHDHVNDYCGKRHGVNLCYGGGVGYGTYGKAGWDRRSRIIEVTNSGKTITTWKILDNKEMTKKDTQTLFSS